MGQTAPPAEAITWDDPPYYLISLAVHRSRRYHAKMRAMYQGLSDAVLAANAVLGAGAFMALMGGKNTGLAQVLIGIVAAGSAVDTVLGFGKKAKIHDDLLPAVH